jgi:hypothetical protein
LGTGEAYRVVSRKQKDEEETFEDHALPTDDEGITTFNQTQKIPISLIKKQDKASVSVTR